MTSSPIVHSRRIGILIPSANPTMEVEFPGARVPHISFHFQRLPLAAGSDPLTLRRMAVESGPAAALLKHIAPSIIAYGCTSGSMIGGRPLEDKIEQMIHKEIDVPVIFTARSVVKALRSLEVSKVAVGTPYTPWVTDTTVDYLAANGISTVSHASLSMTDGVRISQLSKREIMKLIKTIDTEDAEAIFLSCTALPSFSWIADLEKKIKKSIITSNSALLWEMLRELKNPCPQQRLGTLFQPIGP